MKKFSPGVIDYKGEIAASYQAGRALSNDAAGKWSSVLAPFVEHAEFIRVLDLGAGTGRFATLFARSFDIQVIAVEPSTKMLDVAASGDKQSNLAYVAGAAERIPLRSESFDLVWLSHVWHHIQDRQTCASELRRIVRRGGHVLVRGTFGDQLDGFPTLFRYWPSTRAICQQLPTIQETVLVFEESGFLLTEHRRVEQITATSLCEFAKRTYLRSDTALTLLSDSEFQQGQAAIEKSAAEEPAAMPVVETIELLVFRQNSIRSGAA